VKAVFMARSPTPSKPSSRGAIIGICLYSIYVREGEAINHQSRSRRCGVHIKGLLPVFDFCGAT